MNRKLKDFRSRQQADIEKVLEEYKFAFESKEKQLSEAKKILLSAKQS